MRNSLPTTEVVYIGIFEKMSFAAINVEHRTTFWNSKIEF